MARLIRELREQAAKRQHMYLIYESNEEGMQPGEVPDHSNTDSRRPCLFFIAPYHKAYRRAAKEDGLWEVASLEITEAAAITNGAFGPERQKFQSSGALVPGLLVNEGREARGCGEEGAVQRKCCKPPFHSCLRNIVAQHNSAQARNRTNPHTAAESAENMVATQLRRGGTNAVPASAGHSRQSAGITRN